jgi:hypothetical protein
MGVLMTRWEAWRNPTELGQTLAATLGHDAWPEVEPHAIQLWNQTQALLMWADVREHVQWAWEQKRKALSGE